MFEGKLTSVLNKLLGEYVHGISTKDLSVAVFKGDVVLKNLRLKTEALNALDHAVICTIAHTKVPSPSCSRASSRTC